MPTPARSPFHQPPGSPIIFRDGVEWWGAGNVEGLYFGWEGAEHSARRIALERAQTAALREDVVRQQLHLHVAWYFDHHRTPASPTQALELIVRRARTMMARDFTADERSLLASAIATRASRANRYELTDAGRAALAEDGDAGRAA